MSNVSNVTIESDGTPQGTRFYVNGKRIEGVISAEWSAEPHALNRLVLTIAGVEFMAEFERKFDEAGPVKVRPPEELHSEERDYIWKPRT